ncbi:MAG TPA: histidine--tRNA ligase [Xanthobacteraceae bacterium]|nr:histidine--tRNA ligase [Xanthobacteraceae bacterium]
MTVKSMASGKTNKPQKLKARLPRGLADRGPAELSATRAMIEKIRAVYERYGFEAVETPAIEYTDVLGKFLPDQDRPNEGVFSFQDDDEQWLSLRYDLTAPLARHYAENFQTLIRPYRTYRYGWVFRNEKPGPGRYRQFMQFDADTVGASSIAADAEMCMMAADTMEALGIKRGDYVIKMNSRKLLDGVLEAIRLGGDENAGKRLTVLRAIDKLDRLGGEGVRQLLGKERRDESGDVTKGAELDFAQIESLMQYINWKTVIYKSEKDSKGKFVTRIQDSFSAPERKYDLRLLPQNAVVLDSLSNTFGESQTFRSGIEELKEISSLIAAAGYQQRIRVDPSVVRGLEYYTGPVFEAELTFETKDEKGNPARFGSVGGGGRYDGLIARFRGEPVPATGFSIGVSRLLAALQQLDKIDSKIQRGPVVVTVFDKKRIADYQKMAASLRNAGIPAELYLGNPKNIGDQLKYADKRNSPCVVIQGSDEKKEKKVTIKNLIVGAQLAKLEKDRAQHLKKQLKAQTIVLEKNLVIAVRKMLAQHTTERVVKVKPKPKRRVVKKGTASNRKPPLVKKSAKNKSTKGKRRLRAKSRK